MMASRQRTKARRASCPWEKSSTYFLHLQNVRFVRVLRTRDRIVRSKRLFVHSLLGGTRMAEPGIVLAHPMLALDVGGNCVSHHKIRKILALRREADSFSPVASAARSGGRQDAITDGSVDSTQ